MLKLTDGADRISNDFSLQTLKVLSLFSYVVLFHEFKKQKNGLCHQTFPGNTMGEVSFAAVLRWVTRIDDFTWLLTDTTERERVLHLQRSEECSLTFLNW
jgi:hypothetical protein